MAEEFTCAFCSKTYEKIRSDEEAMEEALGNFSEDELIDDPAVVCDDCFKLIMGDEE